MRGIYTITCIPTARKYVGASGNIEQRWASHTDRLAKRRHSHREMQKDYDAHGATAFVYEVVKEMPDASFAELRREEAAHTKLIGYDNCYNTRSGGGEQRTSIRILMNIANDPDCPPLTRQRCIERLERRGVLSE